MEDEPGFETGNSSLPSAPRSSDLYIPLLYVREANSEPGGGAEERQGGQANSFNSALFVLCASTPSAAP